MRVTVCQLPDDSRAFERSWEHLVAHARESRSELIVLPEMPFHPWFAATRRFDPDVWRAVVTAHDSWEKRLPELAPAAVMGSRPIEFGNERYNAAFLWTEQAGGLATVHGKAYLPEEEGTWEASWYAAAAPDFEPARVGNASVGVLICSELWAMEQARLYGKENVHLLVTPRLTGAETLDKWLAGGRVAAILAGAYGLSSNRHDDAKGFGGQGWIVGPDGEVLALTTPDEPFVTQDVDLTAAEQAKHTYPRYVI
jgi:N-carbamoylputrescine amidase